MDRRDLLIRAALTPPATVVAPADLADTIGRAVRTTPQARPWPWAAAAASTRLTTRLVLVLGALLLALLIAIAVGSRPPAPPSGVFGYHGPPSRTGVMPGPLPVGQPVVQWTAPARGQIDATGMPLVAGGTVYIADSGGWLEALTLDGGALRWSTRLDRAGRSTGLILGSSVIHGSGGGRLSAVDATTGAIQWTRDVGSGGVLSIASDGALIVVASSSGQVVGVDATGRTLWTADAGGPVERGATIADGLAFVGATTGTMSAIRLTDGAVAWRTELRPGEILSSAVAGDLLFVPHGIGGRAAPGVVVALRTSDGQERWRWTAPTITRQFLAAVEGRDVYVLTEDGGAFVLDAATGAGRPFARGAGPFGSLAAIVDGTIVLVNNDGSVTAYDRATAGVLWRVEIQGAPSTPAAIDGRILVGTDLGQIFSIGGSTSGSRQP